MNKEEMERLIIDLQDRVEALESKAIGKRFVPPTITDLDSYIVLKGYDFDAEAFIAHYTANGWKVGRNKMKSWQSACVTWERTAREKQKANRRQSTRDVSLRDQLNDRSWAN